MIDFTKFAARAALTTVLCVGDVMLDEFVYGEVSRISPEAPAPVITASRSELAVGGAGNVVRNVVGLGAKCRVVGLVGEDREGDVVRQELIAAGAADGLVPDPGRPTTRKMRFVSEHFATHLLRADWESRAAASGRVEQNLIARTIGEATEADIVILSDYAKGVLTPRLVRDTIAAARQQAIPSIVDPKNSDFTRYRGATVLTPNFAEFCAAAGRTPADDGELEALAREMLERAELEALLITRSEKGMSLIPRTARAVHVPSLSIAVKDVSGAGDTVVASLALALVAEFDWESAMRIANAAAGVAVGKRGTSTVSMEELRHALLPRASTAAEDKIRLQDASVAETIAAWRARGLKVGFTNGCFDILHPGHVKVLTEARATCDRLVVGLNSDASVRRLKGEGRPVQHQRSRAEVLAALEAVDLVVIFDADTPLSLIEAIRPDVLVKGGDYRADQVVGRDAVEANGGRVAIVSLQEGHSTTSIIERSRAFEPT